MKIWAFAYFSKIKTMGISPTLGVDTTTTPNMSVCNQKGMVEKNSKGLLWVFFDLFYLNLAPMGLGSWEMFGDIRN